MQPPRRRSACLRTSGRRATPSKAAHCTPYCSLIVERHLCNNGLDQDLACDDIQSLDDTKHTLVIPVVGHDEERVLGFVRHDLERRFAGRPRGTKADGSIGSAAADSGSLLFSARCKALQIVAGTDATAKPGLSATLIISGVARLGPATSAPLKLACPDRGETLRVGGRHHFHFVGEHRLQHARKFRNRTVLHLIDMKLPLGAGRLGIKPPDPGLRSGQIARLRRHDQNRAKPGICDEPDASLERPLFFGREHGLEFIDHFFRLRAFSPVRRQTTCRA